MTARLQAEFVSQQGFSADDEASRSLLYRSLMFQPRLIGVLVAAGIVFQRAELFLVLSAILWTNALAPRLNPFDAIYNTFLAAPRKLPRLGPAPAPRPFAQGMAGTLMLLIGISLLQGWFTATWVIEAMLAAALLALIFGRFCLGSYIFYLFRTAEVPARIERH
jgi:hypothetical protein